MEKNTIFHGDCLDGMSQMPGEFIDLTVCSPPYNIGLDYTGGVDDKMTYDDYGEFCFRWLSMLFYKTKRGGRLCLNVNNTVKDFENDRLYSAAVFFTNLAEKVGWMFREHITWIKMVDESGEIFAGGKTAWGSWCSASNPQLRNFTEPILIFHKGVPKKEPVGISDITKEQFIGWSKNAWYIMPDRSEHHPAVFPIDIPYRCIKLYSYVGDLVFDPFAGTGTTLDAAKQLKRDYIGCEISDKYHRICSYRMSQKLMEFPEEVLEPESLIAQ